MCKKFCWFFNSFNFFFFHVFLTVKTSGCVVQSLINVTLNKPEFLIPVLILFGEVFCLFCLSSSFELE